MMRKSILRWMLLILLAGMMSSPALAADKGPLVLAAASLQEGMVAAADAWVAKRHPRPILSFAGSSALARQIKAGAPADLFVSADEEWMDDVEKAGFVRRGSRADLVGNRLVLIAPADSAIRLRIGKGMPIAKALGNSRLSIANPESVPAGKYGKAALTSLGVWPSVANRLARGDNVRSALALVERRETPLGIVYATDALASRLVRVVGVFPVGTHEPIRYPLARLSRSSHPDAEGFRRFLLSHEGRSILARFGFTRL